MAKRTKTLSLLKAIALQKIVFKGTVFSGKGEGRKFIELPWVKRQIEEKLGFTPYSGTLNIRLIKRSAKSKKNCLKTPIILRFTQRRATARER